MTAAAPSGSASAAAMESLYPFLYADKTDLDAVMEQVRASTVAKTAEIAALRREVCARDAARLRACAQDMAGRFAAGGPAARVRQRRQLHRRAGNGHVVPPPR